jgi:4-diphosphocytidyl-2-C-methyl-D-erythritol kinase
VRLSTQAPAKVNLVLRVGPLRPDGYHELATLLAPLDLADRVDVAVSPRAGPVRCRVPGRPDLDGPSNLAARAAEAFRARFGERGAVTIRIDKRIPVVAGLGGGSSDAAAVLRCLARAHRVSDRAALAELALSVGSDVPFFLQGGAAWARGRGERLAKAEVPVQHLVLLYPEDPALAIRAGDAYRWLDADRGEARAAKASGVAPLPRSPGQFRPSLLGNDLEPPCLARFPALSTLMGRLREAGAAAVMMSGSGPTVFGTFASRAEAGGAVRRLTKEVGGSRVKVVLARTVRRQPRVTPWRSPRSASSP